VALSCIQTIWKSRNFPILFYSLSSFLPMPYAASINLLNSPRFWQNRAHPYPLIIRPFTRVPYRIRSNPSSSVKLIYSTFPIRENIITALFWNCCRFSSPTYKFLVSVSVFQIDIYSISSLSVKSSKKS